MDTGVRSKVAREFNVEDGEWVYFLVWWVSVVSVATRTVWNHNHYERSNHDACPERMVRLAARVRAAVASGLGEAHFEGSDHWYGEPHETLEERLAPYGTEWQLEQKERQEAAWA